MVDTSGTTPPINGAIGSAVQTGVVSGRRHPLQVVAGQAGRASGEAGAGHPDQRQQAQPRHARLRRVVPLSHDQAVRQHHAEGSVHDTSGGNFKFQLPKGNVTCLVRGSTGQRAVRTVGIYDNNLWHTVRCERTAAGITLTVSDANGNLQETKKLNGRTGNIVQQAPDDGRGQDPVRPDLGHLRLLRRGHRLDQVRGFALARSDRTGIRGHGTSEMRSQVRPQCRDCAASRNANPSCPWPCDDAASASVGREGVSGGGSAQSRGRRVGGQDPSGADSSPGSRSRSTSRRDCRSGRSSPSCS